MSSLPEWMVPRTDLDDRSRLRIRCKHRRPSAARRAANTLARLVSETLTDDATAGHPGLLQGIDSRFKVIGLVGLIVVATLLQSIVALGVCYGLCIILAVGSRVSARRLLAVWTVVPLFSAAILLPAAFNIVTDGNPVWTICRFPDGRFGPWRVPHALAITDAGLLVAGRLVLRTAVCVTLAVLLTSTTSAPKLFRGLRALGISTIFVALLGMMQRYLDVLLRAAHEIHLARLSRSIETRNLCREQAWVAAGMGSLFRRTRALSQAVYMAMLSRGYTGDVRLLDEPRLRSRDWGFLAAIAAAATMLLVFND